MTIPYLPLQRITAMHAAEIHEAVSRVIDGGWYLKGEVTQQFENDYARYIGTRHCIGVANGLDALTLILRAYMEMGQLCDGDEVIVPANTFIASILAITENRLKPVLVEPCLDTFLIDDSLIEQAITPRTKAIMIVHLYGRCAYTERIGALCEKYHLKLIEDNAQAHGCLYDTQAKTGSLGSASGHSFYPGKNLGALGDAGAVTTDDDVLAAAVRSIANYGSSKKYQFDYVGRNSRIDEIQAAVLSVKLKYLDSDNARRQEIANYYIDHISNPLVRLPERSESVYHIFPVLTERRDDLQQFLTEKGVGTVIHYPIAPHQQRCYAHWNYASLPITERIHSQELSLPCHQAVTDEEVMEIVRLMNEFR